MLYSELVQICLEFKFGSGLGQVWFMSCGRSGRRGPSGLEGLLDEPGIHLYGRLYRREVEIILSAVRACCAFACYMFQMKFDEFSVHDNNILRLAVG